MGTSTTFRWYVDKSGLNWIEIFCVAEDEAMKKGDLSVDDFQINYLNTIEDEYVYVFDGISLKTLHDMGYDAIKTYASNLYGEGKDNKDSKGGLCTWFGYHVCIGFNNNGELKYIKYSD